MTASYLADTYAFYRKYLYDLYQEQLLAGGMVPEIVPTFDRQNVPAHGETPHVSSPGTYICSAGTKQYSKTKLRA